MESVTSKKDILKFYITLFSASLFFIVLGTFILVVCVNLFITGSIKPKEYLLLPFGIAFITLAVYNVWRYYSNTPKIIVNVDTIKAGYKHYRITDINQIQFTDKRPLKNFMPHKMEGAKITFKNKDVIYLYDSLYDNSHIIKQFLEQVLKAETAPTNPVLIIPYPSSINSNPFKYYKSTFLLTLREFIFVITTLFTVMLFTSHAKITSIQIIAGVFLIVNYVNALSVNYFGINTEYIIIKNHVLPFKSHLFAFKDIREIVSKRNTKAANALRITTKDF